MHIIVTGSAPRRDDKPLTDSDWSFVFNTLDSINKNLIISSITQGAASGFDEIAKSWAEIRHIQTHDFPADWQHFAKSHGGYAQAGPHRNRHMVRTTIERFGLDNVAVVAFTNKPLIESRGTNNCVGIAQSFHIKEIHHYRSDLGTKEF